MKPAFALALASALLAAGCLEAQRPASGTTPSTASSTPTPATPTAPSPGPGDGLATNAQNVTATLSLVGSPANATLAPGGEYRAAFTATNKGPDATVRGACESPWAIVVKNASGATQALTPSMAHCFAISLEPFPHGAGLTANFSWNGTVYDPGGRASRAPSGDYRIVATFRTERDAGPDFVSVTLHARVA